MAAAGGQRQVGEVVVGEDHHLAAAEVVALGDVVVADLFAADRAGALVLDPPAVGAVHLVEPDVLLLGGRVELDSDRDQPERDRSLPDGPHRAAPSVVRPGLRTSIAHRARPRASGSSACVALGWTRVPRPAARCSPRPVSCRPGPGWAYEFKWDGVRALAVVAAAAGSRLYARSGAEITKAYPELAALGPALADAGVTDAVLDGEIVVLDEDGPPIVHGAGRADARPRRRPAPRQLAASAPRHVHDLRRARGQRHRHLGRCPTSSAGSGSSRSPSRLGGARALGRAAGFADGAATLAAARALALEGVVAKRLDLDLPARPAVAGLDQGQARAHRRLRGRRLATGRARARRAARRARQARRRAATTAAGSAAASRPPAERDLLRRARRRCGRPTRRSPARCPARTPGTPPTCAGARGRGAVRQAHPGRQAALPALRAAAPGQDAARRPADA